jgi:hypothetical protein
LIFPVGSEISASSLQNPKLRYRFADLQQHQPGREFPAAETKEGILIALVITAFGK